VIAWDTDDDVAVAERRTARARRASDRRLYWLVYGAGLAGGIVIGFFGAFLLL
jgi:hypothetical protein